MATVHAAVKEKEIKGSLVHWREEKEKETKRKYIKDKQVLVFNLKYGLNTAVHTVKEKERKERK